MSDNNSDAFLERLQATFRAEAQERLQTLSAALLELENESAGERQPILIESIFREVHSLKGAARAVDKSDVETLCQALESVLSLLKRNELIFTPALADLLLAAADLLSRLLHDGKNPALAQELAAMCAQLGAAERGQSAAARSNAATMAQSATKSEPEIIAPAAAPAPVVERAALPERSSGGDTVRIAAAKLDALLLQVESLLSVKLTAAQRIDDIAALAAESAALKKDHDKIADDVRVLQHRLARPLCSQEKSDSTVQRVLDVFARQDTHLKLIDMRLQMLAKHAAHDGFSIGTMVDTLLDDMKQISMLPIAAAFDVLPKLVRDLARSGGKEVDLNLRGGAIEIDRRILEELRDPLLHLVRNAIDHGIEKPQQRAQAGKSLRASLSIEATQQDGKIQLSIADDGAGIDRERVRTAASRLGKTADSDADDEQALALIFESGLSTSPIVTDISGRGLGLAIVREKIEALGGAIAVSSTLSRGTQFILTLPPTLATYRGVHVLSGGRQFVFPLMHVECVTQFARDAISLVQNREAVTWNDQAIACVRLSDVLELPPNKAPSAAKLPVVIGAIADKRIAFLVDSVVGEQEVLVKNLGRQLLRVRNVAAATVLGDGRVALILNMTDLFKSAARGSGRVLSAPAVEAQPKSILVAEDSITSRMLLRGVLEAAGYRVTVAVDGEDAYAKLRADNFDLLISDIDMPRLNGFDLTARVRADAQLLALPVVLVTSLASVADRERGIDVGASAYIVKSNFEEGNLLAAIQRLL